MNKKYKLTGEKLLKTAVNQILAHPETWRQDTWHTACLTKHCIAGWCQILSGQPANSDSAYIDAAHALGISKSEADFLFRSSISLLEIYYFAEHFDRAGFDRTGKQIAPFEI